jgi:tetratricopeptide (TPR) repeat protein
VVGLSLLPSIGCEYFQQKDRSSAYIDQGNAHSLAKEYDKAIEDYTEAIRLDPNNAAAFFGRGNIYAAKRDCQKSIDDFNEAIRLNPNSPWAFDCRGLAYAATKNYDKAIKDCTEAVRLDPTQVNAANVLAWLLATCPKDGMRDGKRAVELATRACKSTQWKTAHCLETLATAYAECGDFKEAIKWQNRALYLGAWDKNTAQKRLKLYQDGKTYRE